MRNSNIFRTLLATTVLSGAILIAPTAAMAQDTADGQGVASVGDDSVAEQDPGTTEGGQAVPEEEGPAILVTGTRIRRPEAESIVPIATVDAAELEQDAAANIQDTLLELPQFGTGTQRTNSNFLTSANGTATLSLRSLGSQRTLVLVNGRRFIAGFAGSSTVDVNNIPTDFVQRVEVVTGGASSVYGSEAIAGVVNFILKDRYKGFSVRSQYGITERGDNPQFLVSATGGTTFGADDRIRLLGNFSYDRDEGLPSRNRAISRNDCGQPFGPAAGIICGPDSFSVFAPQGQFFFVGKSPTTGNPTVPSVASFSFDPANNNQLIIGNRGPGFNRNAVRFISTPVERYIGAAILNIDITDNLTFFAEPTYSKVRSRSALEPSAIAIGPGGAPDVAQAIPIDNPFIPAPIQAIIAARNSDASTTNDIFGISAQRRFNEVFDRSNRNDRDTYRIATGFRGELGGNWNYEASYVYGRFEDHTESETAVKSRIANALDAIRLPNGQIVCRSEAARAEGCVPLNLFGANTASPEASAYVQAEIPRSLDILNQQHIASASISGSPFALWAGDVGVALGVEYRKEKALSDNDPLTNAGLNIGNLTNDLQGEFDVKEAFAELNIPLIKSRFINYFGLTGAVRVSDYSTIGTVYSWHGGAEFEPARGLRFRGVYSRANRAPNISELFSQPNETFASISDPCNGVTLTNDPGGLGDECRAIPGVLAEINASPTGTFTYTLAQQQQINGFVGGNPNLSEETADTITVGGVFSPDFIPGLIFSMDYFEIKIDEAIGTLGRQFSVGQCLATGNPVFCEQVIRSPQTGRIQTVNGQLINVSKLRTQGIDVATRYSRRNIGLFADDAVNLTLNYTLLMDYESQGNPAAPVTEFRGTAGLSKHRLNARLAYTIGDFTASWQAVHLSKAVATLNFVSVNPTTLAMNAIPAYTYHDMQIRWDLGEEGERRMSFYAGIDNVFDKDPPFLPNPPFSGSPIGTETQSDVYDPFGRRFYAGARIRF